MLRHETPLEPRHILARPGGSSQGRCQGSAYTPEQYPQRPGRSKEWVLPAIREGDKSFSRALVQKLLPIARAGGLRSLSSCSFYDVGPLARGGGFPALRQMLFLCVLRIWLHPALGFEPARPGACTVSFQIINGMHMPGRSLQKLLKVKPA
jgi:hypothetical protein